MHDALLVDVLHPFRDLPHVLDTLSLRQLEVLVDDALKQLTPRHAVGAEEAGKARRSHHRVLGTRMAGYPAKVG